MSIEEFFGRNVSRLNEKNPKYGRDFLKLGWEVQSLRYRFTPERRLMPADRYLALMMMNTMLKPLKRPESSAIVSIFMPCELLYCFGLEPYNVEAFSCYLSASRAERSLLREVEGSGVSETLCSYHRIFIGAAQSGLLPKPKCIVYTNLACDANLLSFRYLAELYEVPCFAVDVPLSQGEEEVLYVSEQLRELTGFLEGVTGRRIGEEELSLRTRRCKRTLANYEEFMRRKAEKYVPDDTISALYCGMANNVLLGTAEQEKYTEMLLNDVKKAPPAKGKRLYWMHTIPFWSSALKSVLSLNENAQIIGCELAQSCRSDFDPEKPYEAMARRLVYHALNGSAERRIKNGIRCAKEARADGAVWFCHWGCKHTLGAAQLAKKRFEEAGLPLLILDGDGADRTHGGEGQTSTRLEAFLEMLKSE